MKVQIREELIKSGLETKVVDKVMRVVSHRAYQLYDIYNNNYQNKYVRKGKFNYGKEADKPEGSK